MYANSTIVYLLIGIIKYSITDQMIDIDCKDEENAYYAFYFVLSLFHKVSGYILLLL